MRTGDYEGAEKDFTKELGLHKPETAMFFRSHFERGFANKHLQKYQEALRDFEVAELAPVRLVYPEMINVASEEKSNLLDEMHEVGRNLYVQAKSRNPTNPEELEKNRQNYLKSVEYFRDVIALSPTKPWVNFDCGMSLARLGKHEEALEYLNAEIALHESGPGKYRPHYERGLIQWKLRKFPEAKSEFEAGLANRDDSNDLIFDRSAWYLQPHYEIGLIYLILSVFTTAVFAAAILEARRQRGAHRPEEDFRLEVEAEKAVRGFARTMLDSFVEESLLESLTNLDQERFLKICKGIAECKNEQEFTNLLARENIPAIEFGSGSNLQGKLVLLFNSLVETCETRPAQALQYPKNFIYDLILRRDDSHLGSIDQARLGRFVTIFKEEAAKTLRTSVDEVMAQQVVEEILDAVANQLEARAEERDQVAQDPGGAITGADFKKVESSSAKSGGKS